MTGEPRRGQIWWVDIGLSEHKRFVIVSNNGRNRVLGSVLGVPLTTTEKPELPSIVSFRPGGVGPSACSALADDVSLIGKERLIERIGALTPGQMSRIEGALRVALALG